jgi:hypothetical protein
MRKLILILAAALGAACATSDASSFGVYPSRHPEAPVAVYASSAAPAAILDEVPMGRPPGKVIGKVDVQGGPFTSWGTAIDEAKDAARDMGGTGILIGHGEAIYTGLSVTVYRR